MKKSTDKTFQTLGIKCIIFFIPLTNWLGHRTVSHNSWFETNKMILDKVLSDERATAYATTIDDINRRWSDCKECDWYKSKQTVLSEARFSMYW